MRCGYRSGGPRLRDRASCEEPLGESLCTELRPGAAPRKGCTATPGPDSASDVEGGVVSAGALEGARRTRDSAAESMGLIETLRTAGQHPNSARLMMSPCSRPARAAALPG